MTIDFKEIVLDNYGGIKLKANADEKPNEIIAAVCYRDHGDDFLVIKTEDACYEYGLYINRNGWNPDLLTKEDHYQRSWFIKIPELIGSFDFRSRSENAIFFLIENELYSERDNFGWRRKKVQVKGSKRLAQWDFDYVYRRIKEEYEKGVLYHCGTETDNQYYLGRIIEFLNANDIFTEENQNKIEELKKYLRMEAIDGYAGKRKHDGYVYGDDIIWVYYKDKKVIKKYHKHGIKVKSQHSNDEFGGYNGFSIDMEQFK